MATTPINDKTIYCGKHGWVETDDVNVCRLCEAWRRICEEVNESMESGGVSNQRSTEDLAVESRKESLS